MAILTGIVAFIRAIPIVDKWVQMLISAYMQAQTADVLAAVADAAAMGARAKTDDDRYKSAIAWQSALSKSRVLS